MTYEKEKFGLNYTDVTLPNGKRGIMDSQGYALEQIAADTWVEWFGGKRVSVLDGRMHDLDAESVRQIIEKLGMNDVQQIRV